MKRILFSLPLVALLAACSQSDAPSEKIGAVAEDIVDVAQGSEPAPKPVLGPYAPRDECAGVEGAAAFRAQLEAAVKARDTDALVALAADDIKLDFGGGSGAAELRDRLGSKDAGLWLELDKLMTLGCAKNELGGITMPWYFAQNLNADPFQAMIVTGKDIPLLSGESGKVLAKVDWDVVLMEQGAETPGPFTKVSYGEIKDAYVATAMLRSPIDYRLIASSRNGKWSITALVAGD